MKPTKSSEPADLAQKLGPARADRVWLLLILAAAVLFAVRIWCYYAPAYHAGVDESTYFLTARAIAQTGSPAIYSPDPLQFTPANLIEVRPGVFYQKYPIGYPLLVAAGYRVAGPAGAFLVNPILGVCCLLFTALLARELLGKWPAVVVAFCMALSPAMLFFSNSALSHVSDTCFAVLGLWLLLLWIRRGGWLLPLASGLALGIAASIRNSEALLMLPVLWAIWVRLIQPNGVAASAIRPAVVALSLFAAGAIIAQLPNFAFQYAAFGSPFVTGYDFTGESTAFSLGNLLHNMLRALAMFNASSLGLPVFFPLAIAFITVMTIRTIQRPADPSRNAAQFLALWILPTFLLYTAYYWSSPFVQLYLRLFLSIYPAIIIAAVAALDRIASRWPTARIALLAVPIATSLVIATYAEEQILQTSMMAWIAKEGSDLANSNLPPKSVLIADDVSAFHVVFATDFDVYSPGNFTQSWVERHFAMSQRPPYEFDPFRAQRYFPLVFGHSQDELDAMLRDVVRSRLKNGQPAGLLTNAADIDTTADWARRLGPDLILRDEVRGNAGWIVYRIVTKQ